MLVSPTARMFGSQVSLNHPVNNPAPLPARTVFTSEAGECPVYRTVRRKKKSSAAHVNTCADPISFSDRYGTRGREGPDYTNFGFRHRAFAQLSKVGDKNVRLSTIVSNHTRTISGSSTRNKVVQ